MSDKAGTKSVYTQGGVFSFPERTATFDIDIDADVFQLWLGGMPKATPIPGSGFIAELTHQATEVLDLPKVRVLFRDRRHVNKFTDARTRLPADYHTWPPKAIPEHVEIEYDVGNDEYWHPYVVVHEVAHVLDYAHRGWECYVLVDAHTLSFYQALEEVYYAVGLDSHDVRRAIMYEHSYTPYDDARIQIRLMAKRLGYYWPRHLREPIRGVDAFARSEAVAMALTHKRWWNVR